MDPFNFINAFFLLETFFYFICYLICLT